MSKTKHGKVIAFEGPDFVGKTTLIASLSEHLTNLGFVVRVFRQPGGSPFAEKLRALMLEPSDTPANAIEMAACMGASRLIAGPTIQEFVSESEFHIALVDRWALSNRVYQLSQQIARIKINPTFEECNTLQHLAKIISDMNHCTQLPIDATVTVVLDEDDAVLNARKEASARTDVRMKALGEIFTSTMRKMYRASFQEPDSHTFDDMFLGSAHHLFLGNAIHWHNGRRELTDTQYKKHWDDNTQWVVRLLNEVQPIHK
jgi:thymidylate kinase